MFVLVITGNKDSGKTSAISSVTKRIRNNSNFVNNLLSSSSGLKLNKNNGMPDFFEIIEKSNLKIGILSAGDKCNDFSSCVNDLLKFNPDIIICAARKYAKPSILKKIKNIFPSNSVNYINIESENLNTLSSLENKICSELSSKGYHSIL